MSSSKKSDKSEKLHFYIVTDGSRLIDRTIKVGIHTGTMNKLIGRYSTYFPHIVVLFFKECKNAEEIEDDILIKFEDNRIRKEHTGNESEWLKNCIPELFNYLLTIKFEDYPISTEIIEESKDSETDDSDDEDYVPPKSKKPIVKSSISTRSKEIVDEPSSIRDLFKHYKLTTPEELLKRIALLISTGMIYVPNRYVLCNSKTNHGILQKFIYDICGEIFELMKDKNFGVASSLLVAFTVFDDSPHFYPVKSIRKNDESLNYFRLKDSSKIVVTTEDNPGIIDSKQIFVRYDDYIKQLLKK